MRDDIDAEDVRLAIYHAFATKGRVPPPAELAAALDASPSQVGRTMQELEQARHIVLDEQGRVVLAHPFSSVPMGFAVMGASTLWWGGCAWDSFALPHLLPHESEVLVSSQCPGCAKPLAWVVGRDASPSGNEVAHFLVPVSQIWDDVVHTCRNQRLFCGQDCVEAWLDRSALRRGYVMDLETLWRLARGWYAGRLDRGYVRREPAAAADYFRSVGLKGSFWGL
jgi:hypothetical protein